MDRRMLTIGVVTIAFAVGCGDSDEDKASQLPEGLEIEATAPTAPPNSGRIGEPIPSAGGTDRSDAAQSTGATSVTTVRRFEATCGLSEATPCKAAP